MCDIVMGLEVFPVCARKSFKQSFPANRVLGADGFSDRGFHVGEDDRLIHSPLSNSIEKGSLNMGVGF